MLKYLGDVVYDVFQGLVVCGLRGDGIVGHWCRLSLVVLYLASDHSNRLLGSL
jgi:hypothetical protein